MGWEQGTRRGPACEFHAPGQVRTRASVSRTRRIRYNNIPYDMRRAHCRPQPAPGVPIFGSISALAPLPLWCGPVWSMGWAVRSLAPTSSPWTQCSDDVPHAGWKCKGSSVKAGLFGTLFILRLHPATCVDAAHHRLCASVRPQ